MSWDERHDNRVMLTYSDEWTWREATTALNNALTLVGRVSHEIALIFDLSGNTFFPPGGLIEHIKTVREKIHQHPNISLILIVMPPDSTRDMVMAAVQMYSSPSCTCHFLNAMDDAYNAVAQQLKS